MRKFLLSGATAVALTLSAMGAANAGLLTITPGPGGLTFGSVPGSGPPNQGTNEALGPIFGLPGTGDSGFGYYGATITGTAGASYTYDVFGAEAGFANKFMVGAATVYTHPAGASNISLVVKGTLTSSSLNFSFVPGTGTTATNGTNPNNTLAGAGPNFFSTFDIFDSSSATNPTTGDVLWLLFDDASDVDDNHDDLVVRITATAVPEPATLALFGAGLLGLGLVRRRRQG